MMKVVLPFLCSLAIAAGWVPPAVASQPGQVSSSVPELEAFHDVIYPMWHDAYPKKDGAALRALASDVRAGAAKVAAAKLPPILHEKEAAWAKGMAEFKASADAYVQAAGRPDDAALLVAAEHLHTTYEGLVRVIRPVVKEMDDFHKLLYVVQHEYLPGQQWDAICGASADLVARADALAKATLPKRVESKQDAFRTASAALAADTRALASACQAKKPAEIEKAATSMHDRYEALAALFD